ncbi:MAG: SIS domain-containing protein [Anaerolineae bacterium]|nr:SIS domain-containing protein [Anaerolineae bacterium]
MQEKYFDLVLKLVADIEVSEADNIRKAARLVADSLISNNWVYTFGSGHSQLLAMEVHSRAGGLYPVVHLPDPMNGRAEKVEGFGPVLVEGINFKKGETIFVISNSGRNPEPIEIAMTAKSAGVKVIVLSSMAHSKSIKSRHSSGKMLYELGDVVIDTHTPAGDTSIPYENSPVKSGAMSTITGAVIMNAVMVEAIQYMLDAGVEPPVLLSSNIDGSDEHNQRLMDKFGQFPQPRFV